jgi:uncharacterized protein (TIGR02246 family)
MTMKTLFPIVATLLVLAISGCAPQVDVAVEEAAIRSADADCLKAWAAKDVDLGLSCYSDDASAFPSNAPIATGKEAIRALWSQMFETPGFALSWDISKLEVSRAGDLAYAYGTYEQTVNDPEGNPVTERGKWVGVYKKQADGQWKLVADIGNSDGPAASE